MPGKSINVKLRTEKEKEQKKKQKIKTKECVQLNSYMLNNGDNQYFGQEIL